MQFKYLLTGYYKQQNFAIGQMRKIFKILNETETDKRKSMPSSDSKYEKSAVVPESLKETKKPSLQEITHNDPELKVLTKSKLIEADTFNLVAANRQVRIALDPLTVVGEQFRMLRTRLGLLQKEKGIKTVLITSSIPGEGKTFAACCLAGVFAQEPGKRVLLIDCDMRKLGSGSNIGVNGRYSSKGMSMLLRGELKFPDALLKAVGLEFFFVPNGPLPQNPTELLSSPILEQTIRSAAEDFDWVVIDSPPVLTLSDSTLLAPLCDTSILVVKTGVTPSKLVKDAVKLIGREKICGIVFNRRKQKYPDRYYYYYKKK
jgi:protein-tyrosine kinase